MQGVRVRRAGLTKVAMVSMGAGWLAACGRAPSEEGRTSARASAASGSAAEVAGTHPVEPNPVYPIVVSIAGRPELVAAAAAAEARSKALDELCKGLDIAPELAATAPAGGGCPRPPDASTPWGVDQEAEP